LNYRIIIHPKAEEEYLDACHYYEREREGLGTRFKNSVLDHLGHVLNNLEAYPVKKRNYRESNIKAFPYIIVYRIDRKQNIMYVSAIYHSSRNPRGKYRK